MVGSTIAKDAGALILAGFEGTTLPVSFERALRAGERGGAILFRRNLGELPEIVALTRAIAVASPAPAFIAIDQEGGRVARLGPPFLRVPAARRLSQIDPSETGEFIERVAACQASQLRAVGITVNFAPVFDVHSNEQNPIIGDRAFGTTAASATRGALAYARGLLRGGVLPCAKHFPGHGDTNQDSHEELPVVDAARERLEQVELPPFVAAAHAGVPFMMTAHVVYPAWDPLPATLASSIATTLVRGLGFEGALLSDDLEMRAIAEHYTIEESSVRAVAAGCDGLLICRSEELQARAHEALVREAEASAPFRARIKVAAERMTREQLRIPHASLPTLNGALEAVGDRESSEMKRELEARGAWS